MKDRRVIDGILWRFCAGSMAYNPEGYALILAATIGLSVKDGRYLESAFDGGFVGI